ncbi:MULTISPECIES: hypothetical protein [Thermomonospora]|uniref:Guanylate cyclase domain-containing protein n=1 Tax=Thermomonospora curvata (strain ATCC 19995 / DSM 43183 / JCM 3096 / KCTC 9072 / NBRC 15933 / NCIMB 10081 / Henssen B9) TaxID=471852 RepID=D1A2H8_THECD|nr:MULTISPECIES: hypothetical protein [Thermomonospora]ACY95998.1 hypothetical protein Tcur_0398 [Thermomonospora curvata DSM 43183]
MGRHPIVVVDIKEFGRRPDGAQKQLRKRLYRVMWNALDAAGIVREDVHPPQDRGDGAFWILPTWVSPAELTGPLVRQLHRELQQDADSDPEGAMRVRVALHIGKVSKDSNGWVGTDLNTACRLVDADELRRVLELGARPLMALILSRQWREEVRHRHIEGLDLKSGWPVRIAVKEVADTAWIHLPGHEDLTVRLWRIQKRWEELLALEEQVRTRRDEIAERLTSVPDMPDPPPELRRGRDLLPLWELVELDAEVFQQATERWWKRITKLGRRVEKMKAERDELRKTIEAFQARQNQSGLAEDLHLSAAYRRARDLLWHAPCDLPRAKAAVDDYIQEIWRKLHHDLNAGGRA